MQALTRYHGNGLTLEQTTEQNNALSDQTITGAIPRQEVELHA